MGLIAQKERDMTRKRTKDKLATKCSKGERYSGILPYGFGMHETFMVPIKDGSKIVYKPGVLVPIEQEQKVVSLMCQLADEGKSYHGIAQALTLLGYKNREGKPFQKMSIYRILALRKRTKSLDQLQEAK